MCCIISAELFPVANLCRFLRMIWEKSRLETFRRLFHQGFRIYRIPLSTGQENSLRNCSISHAILCKTLSFCRRGLSDNNKANYPGC